MRMIVHTLRQGGMLVKLPWELIAAVAVGMALLFVAGRVLIVPNRFIWRVCCSAVMGTLGLLGLNIIGAFVGVQLALNPCTALIAGSLGLPGVALIHVVGLISA